MKEKRKPEDQEAIDKHVPIDEFMTSEIRRACRVGFQLCTQRLIAIAAGEVPDTTPFASIRAIDLLGKYSMGKQPEHLHIEGFEMLSTITELVAQHMDRNEYLVFADKFRATVEQMI